MSLSEIRLRSATLEDARLLWEWSCDPHVRAMAFDPSPVTWEAHLRWMQQRLVDRQSFLTILEHRDGTPVGQLRFDRVPEGYEIDFSIAAPFRGHGYGTQLLRQAIALALREWPAGTTIIARVLAGNPASLRACAHAGLAPAEYGTEARGPYVRLERRL